MLCNCPVLVLIAFNSQPIIVPIIVVTTVIVIFSNIEAIPLKRQIFSVLPITSMTSDNDGIVRIIGNGYRAVTTDLYSLIILAYAPNVMM